MKKQIGFIFFIVYGITLCSAQQTLSSAGGEAIGTSGTMSYTIGQVAFTTMTQSEGAVSQGVQQPYEISVIPGVEGKFRISLELSIYPNPTREYLRLKATNYISANLTYQLYDLNGALLENKKLVGDETNIQMDFLSPSAYFLKVTVDDTEIKTFKIIKY